MDRLGVRRSEITPTELIAAGTFCLQAKYRLRANRLVAKQRSEEASIEPVPPRSLRSLNSSVSFSLLFSVLAESLVVRRLQAKSITKPKVLFFTRRGYILLSCSFFLFLLKYFPGLAVTRNDVLWREVRFVMRHYSITSCLSISISTCKVLG